MNIASAGYPQTRISTSALDWGQFLTPGVDTRLLVNPAIMAGHAGAMRRHPLTECLLLPFLLWGGAPTQTDPPALSVEQVLERMAALDGRREAELQSYTVTRRYFLENKRFRKQAEMLVRMAFRAPGTKRFEVLSEGGSGTVRNRVFRRMIEAEREASRDSTRDQTQITPANYEFRLLGIDSDRGRVCYLLQTRPKTQNKFLWRGRIWVDAEDFAISRIEGSPAENPSFWTRKIRFVHEYGKFGPFWLAVSNRSETEVLIFGHTEVTIKYFSYKINQPQR